MIQIYTTELDNWTAKRMQKRIENKLGIPIISPFQKGDFFKLIVTFKHVFAIPAFAIICKMIKCFCCIIKFKVMCTNAGMIICRF